MIIIILIIVIVVPTPRRRPHYSGHGRARWGQARNSSPEPGKSPHRLRRPSRPRAFSCHVPVVYVWVLHSTGV